MNILTELASKSDSPVLVIGSSGIDFIGRLTTDLELGTSNPSRIRTSYGGVGRNISENLARLGQPVSFITAVGSDENGKNLINHLEISGVNVQAIVQCDDCPTGAYLAVLDAKGDLRFGLDDMRAMNHITSAYLREKFDLFKESSMLVVDANLPKKTLRTAFSLARRAKIPVCADPTSASLADRLIPYLDRLFLVTPNDNEASVLSEQAVNTHGSYQAIAAAQKIVSKGSEIAIITLGQYGLCYATSQTSGNIPAIRTKIIDPTGAGDALTAAVIFALLNEIPLDDAVRLGVSAATITLRYPGAVVPDLSLEMLYDELVI